MNFVPGWLVLIVILIITMIRDVQFVSASVIVEYFELNATSEAFIIQWGTTTEINNVGFYVQRSLQISGSYNRVSTYIPTDAEEGQGADYLWFDEDVIENVVYYYRLEAIDSDGVSQFAGPISGSLNESLITSTPPSPTSTRTLGQATATRTQTPQRPPSTATQTSTSRLPQISPTSAQFGTTPTAGVSVTETMLVLLTGTPQPTSAFEPLPTIELLFPATDTPQSLLENRSQLPSPTPQISENGMTLQEGDGNTLARYRILFALIGALWVCLGLLFIFLIRKFNS